METEAASSTNTKRQTSSQAHFTHHVSVPSGQGARVDQTITIDRPVSQVYAFWNRFENLPQFMRHLQSVRVRDDLHSHWTIKTLGDKTVEWDAEIIERRENQMISWRSLPGADVDNAGSVWFTPVNGGTGTSLRVEMKYAPPSGKAAVWAAKLFGEDAQAEIQEDLQRLKSLLETGKLPAEPMVKQWQRRAAKATRQAAERADQFVRTRVSQSPWVYLASLAALGLIVGFVVGRAGGRPRRALDAERCC